MRRVLLVAVAATALGISACGSTNTADTTSSAGGTATVSSNHGTTVNPGGPISTATATASTGGTNTSTGTATGSQTGTGPVTVTTETITAPDNSGGAGLTTGGQSASQQCVAADLKPAAVPPNGAPGITVLGFTLTNTSSNACESGAYPGIGLISSGGSVDDVSTIRTTTDNLGATPVTRIDLQPGQEMSFRITLHDSGAGCGSYTGVQIIAPNDTATLDATVPDGPVQSCGSVDVSPVEPGANGTGQ